MAFISEKKRESLIKKINKSYGFRKFLICIEMIALFAFIIVVLLQGMGIITTQYVDSNKKLTTFGIGMMVWALVVAVLGLITMILILTLKSPKSITKQVSQLESSAIGGKRNDKNSAANYRDRTLSKKAKEKAAKK